MGFNIYGVKSLERKPAWHTGWFLFRVRSWRRRAANWLRQIEKQREDSSNQDAASSKPLPIPLPPPPPLIRLTPSARSGGDAASKLRQWSVLTNPPLESGTVGTCGWSVSTQINGVRDRRRGRGGRKTQQPSRKCQARGRRLPGNTSRSLSAAQLQQGKKKGRFVLKQQLTSSTSNSSITSDLKPRAGEANMNLYAGRRSSDDCSD